MAYQQYDSSRYSDSNYGQGQEYRPDTYYSYDHDFVADYAPPDNRLYWDHHQPDSTGDYITVPRQSRADHILPGYRSTRSHRSNSGGYGSRHSTSDYISPPVEHDDDYILPRHNDNPKTTYYQDSRGPYLHHEQHEPTNYPTSRIYYYSYAEPSEDKPYKISMEGTEFDKSRNSIYPHSTKTFRFNSYEQRNDGRDEVYRVSAQSARPRLYRPTDECSLRHSSVNDESDPETCVEDYDSEAQRRSYRGNSNVGSSRNEHSLDRLCSRSPAEIRYRSSTPDGRCVRSRSSSRSLRIQGYDSSSLSSDNGINSDCVRERNPSDSPVARGRSSSLAASNSDRHGHRSCTRSPTAQNHLSITLSDYASSDDEHGQSVFARSRRGSDHVIRGGSEEYMSSDGCNGVIVGSESDDGYEDDCVDNGSSDDDEYDEYDGKMQVM
jgi:hypothetical protein